MKKLISYLAFVAMFAAFSATSFAMYVEEAFAPIIDPESTEKTSIKELVSSRIERTADKNPSELDDMSWNIASDEELLLKVDDTNEYITRGELTNRINIDFGIREKKKGFIDSCYDELEFCTFTFVAQTNFIVVLEPQVQLYPDVDNGHSYYEDINLATLLGYVNGYIDEQNSPFKPNQNVTRIEALKVILGANDLVPPKYKFQMIESLGSVEALLTQTSYFDDVSAYASGMWWYPRYVNFALDAGIIDKVERFRPEDYISKAELEEMIERTKKYLNEME